MRFKKYETNNMKVATIALILFVLSLLFCFANGLHASALIVAGSGGGGTDGTGAGPEYNCGDGYHPTVPVYNAMGSCIFNEIESISSTGGNPFSRKFEGSFKLGVNNQP